MSDLDHARELVKNTLFDLPEQLRPQDACTVAADLAYLTPAIGALIDRLNQRLGSAERLPGLYTTAPGGDPRAELRHAHGSLTAAQHAADTLTAALDDVRNVLSTIGHGDATDTPLSVADDDPRPPRHPGWRPVD